jgi:hypothetical protein
MSAHRLFAVALLALAAQQAAAGRPCETQAQPTAAVERGMALAEATAKALDASGEQVLVLARAGQDLSKYGLRWSHLGIAYKSGDGAGSYWRVVHKLNHCGTADSALYRQGLGEFFLDRPHRYEAAFLALAPEVQARLLPLLRDNVAIARWHEPRYNMVAYPWAQRYQQSNQWAIETLAGALEPGASDRQRAQQWLQFKGYEPSTLQLGALTRLGARVGMAHVAFDDHPNHKRFADRIETVTVDSVFTWLPRAGLASGGVRMVRL